MKHFYNFLAITLMLIANHSVCQAQTDIATLEGKTVNQLVKMLGRPLSGSGKMTDYDPDCYEFKYKDTHFFHSISHKYIDSFETTSDKYCILSNLIDGGIRVGDPISKIQSFDFSATPYGRGKKANNLTPYKGKDMIVRIGNYLANYWIYSQEAAYIWLAIYDGEVKGWWYHQVADATGYDRGIPLFK